MKESQIIYEREPYFVMLENGKYYVMRNTSTHSVSEETCYEDRSIAKARVDYLAKRDERDNVPSEEDYRKAAEMDYLSHVSQLRRSREWG